MAESTDPRFGPDVPGATGPADGGVQATGGSAGTAVAGAGTMPGLRAGAFGEDAQRGQFTSDVDAHYRALYEAAPASGRSYDSVRPAYVFGQMAASEPGLAGQSFEEAEPALREAWSEELRARAGDWATVRSYVHDAYGHARAEGIGERRDPTVIGSAGSAVDPVELDRARHLMPSVEDASSGSDRVIS